MIKYHKTIKEIVGSIMVVDGVMGAKYGEMVKIVEENGNVRNGKVLEVYDDKAVVELFDASNNISIANSKIRFLGKGL